MDYVHSHIQPRSKSSDKLRKQHSVSVVNRSLVKKEEEVNVSSHSEETTDSSEDPEKEIKKKERREKKKKEKEDKKKFQYLLLPCVLQLSELTF